jgi:hypothetical protein
MKPNARVTSSSTASPTRTDEEIKAETQTNNDAEHDHNNKKIEHRTLHPP